MSDVEQSVDRYVEEHLTFARWAAALRNEVLLGQTCPSCEYTMTTPKAVCAECGETDLSPIRLPTHGEVYSESGVSVAPAGFDPGYRLALVELHETGGARILGRIEGKVDIGDTVELIGVFEGDDAPCPVFGLR